MTVRHPKELLYDSEAALRLVDSAIEDIRDARPDDPARNVNLREQLAAAGPTGSIGLSEVLARSYGEVVSTLGSLRQSRTTLERMQAPDIASQQLSYASSVLTEMETRLADLATLLDPATLGGTGA